MSIAAVLGIKDEVELVDRVIAHLRAIGVDQIIACNMQSTDGTAEILREYALDDDVWLVSMSDRLGHEEWAGQILELAQESGADWVTFLDGDEFPLPASGSLRDCATLADADAIRLDRYNVVVGPKGPVFPDQLDPDRYDELLLLVEANSGEWAALTDDAEASWMRCEIDPRVLARPGRVSDLTIGAHDVVPRDAAGCRRATADDLIVAHLPLTSRARFERKVENVRQIFDSHDQLFGDEHGLHWRRWAALAARGQLQAEFRHMIYDASAIAEMRGEGVIRSAAEVFERRLAPPQRSQPA
jgi:hypothetical protein